MTKKTTYRSIFTPNSRVSNRGHRLEMRALSAGCETLTDFQVWRKAQQA